MVALVLLHMLLQARQQRVEGLAAQEGLVEGDVGLPVAGEALKEALIQCPAPTARHHTT